MEFRNLCKNRDASQESAFTFVELLVVIFVLVLLAIMVLPANARTSGSTRRAICINNLRQIGRAVAMYASDNNDYLPYPNWGAPNTLSGMPGPGWLYTPVGGAPPNLTVAPYNSNPAIAYATGLLYPYVRNQNSYVCAVDRESKYFSVRANKLSSYVMNGAVCGFNSTYRSCRITAVWSPDCYLMWNPDENIGNPPIGNFAYNDASSYPDRNEGIATLHTLNGADVVTLAGSVCFATNESIENAKTNSSGKTLVWWSPFSTNGR